MELFHNTILAPRISRWLLEFWNIRAPLRWLKYDINKDKHITVSQSQTS